jgi:RecB family exonuclease
MKTTDAPFLRLVAEHLIQSSAAVEDHVVIFPTRRSILYFRKHLTELIKEDARYAGKKAFLSPDLFTLDQFVTHITLADIPDQFDLVHLLYEVYQQITKSRESFDSFYFWGNIMLRDFDEIDKHLLNPDQVFRDVSNLKELDDAFDYLEQQQREFLTHFWSNIRMTSDDTKKKFLQLWRQLPEIYRDFRNRLKDTGKSYEGMMYRFAAENIRQLMDNWCAGRNRTKLVFAGFHALTPAEEKIFVDAISHLSAKIFWDIDAYYFNSSWHEASAFFRQYRNHPILSSTFPADIPSNFEKPKVIRIYGSPVNVGQAKLLTRVLKEAANNGMNQKNAVVVLPDERLLLPVLYSIPRLEGLPKINVSLSYPLWLTPVVSFLERVVELHYNSRNGIFLTRDILPLIRHPYLCAICTETVLNQLQRRLIRDYPLKVSGEELQTDETLFRLLFRSVDTGEFIGYLKEVLNYLYEQISSKNDQEYSQSSQKQSLYVRCLQEVYKLLLKMEPLQDRFSSLRDMMVLLRQLIREARIPFLGEPLEGLPVIGMLETRNLDFEHVFILSVNEGFIPPSGRNASYLPYSVRRAYNLPAAEDKDAISAYYFYRLLQRARYVYLFYVTEADELGRGEKSRFIQQLELESNHNPEIILPHNVPAPLPVAPIVIDKTPEVMKQLYHCQEKNWHGQGLTPTALYSYLVCPLQFYLKYVVRLREPAELEEEMSARLLGDLIHHVMEEFYKKLTYAKQSMLIEPDDLSNPQELLLQVIHTVFLDRGYGVTAENPDAYAGQLHIVYRLVERMARQILDIDRKFAPFTLLGVEQKNYTCDLDLPGLTFSVQLGGQIDRIDYKDNTVRIVDYKTGSDEIKFSGVDKIFTVPEKNKPVFQTLLYALLYVRNNTSDNDVRVVPGIYNRKNIFDENFSFGFTDDARALLDEFEALLKEKLLELFDQNKPFVQTSNPKICRYCAFNTICYRHEE